MGFKNPFRHPMVEKPHLLVQYGYWVCSNANARGEGQTQRSAYRQWHTKYQRWANNPARLQFIRGPYRNPGAVPPAYDPMDDL